MDVAPKRYVVKRFVQSLKLKKYSFLYEGVTERLIVADCKSVGFPS